jgi:hypothetical protein
MKDWPSFCTVKLTRLPATTIAQASVVPWSTRKAMIVLLTNRDTWVQGCHGNFERKLGLPLVELNCRQHVRSMHATGRKQCMQQRRTFAGSTQSPQNILGSDESCEFKGAKMHDRMREGAKEDMLKATPQTRGCTQQPNSEITSWKKETTKVKSGQSNPSSARDLAANNKQPHRASTHHCTADTSTP